MGRNSVGGQVQYHIPPENNGPSILRGPRKVLRFCILAVFLPCALVSLCLLMRFVVNGNAIYHLAPSDMRILDDRISTIWCQSESVKANVTFNAYLTDGEPEMVKSADPMVVERHIIIPDDHKEYWGFYLLEGSKFKVYTCARFKGGTLLVVQGRNHLEHCAYIGEADSAGNSDEFSSSNSRELPNSNNSSAPSPNGPDSKEEMGTLLSKIRHYIRSQPKNYGKLKKNLADWMLFEENNSTGEGQESEVDKQNDTASVNLIPIASHNHTTDLEMTPQLLEHGQVLRNRRHVTELRKISESGENGAFEEESGDDDEVKAESAGRRAPPPTHSIWSQEHMDDHGILDHHGLNPDDGSDSESESSWSSSEEAMAKCEGVLGSFVLKANETCGLEDGEWSEPFYEGYANQSGYYYFIFGSENEKRDNIIRAKFELEKFIYHLPEPLDSCRNVRECHVNLTFASNEKLVITVPQPLVHSESEWNDVYIAESECLPRTHVYLIFVLLVPLIILFCAFQ